MDKSLQDSLQCRWDKAFGSPLKENLENVVKAVTIGIENA
jgi:hypothetical protein